MANATITVLEADGTTQTDVVVLDVARQAAAASKSVAMATEDKSQLDAAVTALQLLDNAISGSEMQVDVITMPTTTVTGTVTANIGTGITKGAGTVDSTTTRVTIESGQLGSLGQTTASASVSVTPASDRQNSEVYVLVMSVTTSILAAGEIIADTQQADAFFNKSDGAGVINSLTIVDEAAQAAAINIVVMRTSTSLGTENSTANITDANLTAGVIGVIPVATTDWITISGASVACIQNIGLPVTAVTGTDDLYFAVLNGAGTPTYAGADDIVLKFGVLQD